MIEIYGKTLGVKVKNQLELKRAQSLLKDRARLLQQEVKAATEDIRKSELETLTILGKTAEYKDHEKFDGTGYPKGLKGRDMTVLGRVVALCDVFDSLTSKRPYKDAWSFKRLL